KSSSSTYSVGEIPLQYGVSGSGARTYSVPIYTAPDIKYAPSLSLVYNSQGGVGYGGYGWDLGGISAITLSSESLYWDGQIKAASTLDTAGVFCLDGVRLVNNNDVSTRYLYPLVSASGHVLVAPHRNSRNYITSFTALYPDGTVAIYGTTNDDGFTSPFFPITCSTNIEGERIVYSYTYDSSDPLSVRPAINRIDFGFDASNQPTGSIRFGMAYYYTTYNYYAGKRICWSPRLTSISSFSGNTAIYTYSLSYINSGDDKLLKTISLSNNSDEMPPSISFTYGAEDLSLSSDHTLYCLDTLSMASIFEPDAGPIIYRRGKFIKSCYNDGLIGYENFITYKKTQTNPDKFEYCYPANAPIAFNASIADTCRFTSIEADSGFITAEAVDVDGDGIDEVVTVRHVNAPIYTNGSYLNVSVFRPNQQDSLVYVTGNSYLLDGLIACTESGITRYSPYRRTIRWGDFTGEGRTQLLVVNYTDNGFDISQTNYAYVIDPINHTITNGISSVFPISSGQDNQLFCMDIDGDGRTEICLATTGGLKVYRFIPGGFQYIKTFNFSVSFVTSPNTYFADINADGYMDIVHAPTTGSSWSFYINTGLDFEAKNITICQKGNDDRVLFIDINQDGLPDLLRASGYMLYVYMNRRGMSFDSYYDSSIYISSAGAFLPPNIVEYSSMSSFMVADGQRIYNYGYSAYASLLRQLIQSKDSYGKIIINRYGYLPELSLYWTDNPQNIDSSAGYQLRVMPIYVLQYTKGLLSENTGAQIYLQEAYSWFDGVFNNRGLGFCGFSKTLVESHLDNISIIGENCFNPQRRGVLTSSKHYYRDDPYHPFSTATLQYDNHTFYGKDTPRLIQSVSSDNLTGITSTVSYSYDSFDYPIRIYTKNTATGYTNAVSAVYNTYTHNNSTSKYVLGVLSSQVSLSDIDGTSSNSMGNRTVYIRDTIFRPVQQNSYRIDGGALSQSSSTPPSYTSHLVSRSRWTYDTHGNVTREESAPSGSNVFVGKSYAYDSSGKHMVSSTDELGHVTLYSGFNAYGAPTTITNYKGQNTSVTYDGWGRVTQTTYPDGTVEAVSRSWSTVGSYQESKTVTGQPDVKVTYDALGREVLSSQKRFDGQWQKVKTEYGQRSFKERVSLPYKGSSPSLWRTYQYDNYGRPTRIRDTSGRETTWSYSGTAVTEVKDGVSTTRKADAAGNLKKVTDASGTFTYYYRDDGQPSYVRRTLSTTVTFAYDTIGRRTSIVDPSAGTRTTSYTINSNGTSSVTETNALGSIISSYDALGRMTGIVRPDFNTVFSYDTCGRLISAVSTNSTSTEYTYDAYDRVLTFKESVPDSRWLQKAYTYGSGGNVSSIAYTSQRGYITTETYGYTNGHNTSITLPDNTVVFQLNGENALGQPTSATSGSVSRSYGYTNDGLPAFRKLNNGTLQNFAYTFDATTGNLSSRARTQGGTTTTETFSYDNLGRLSAIGSNTITYSAANNITSVGGLGTMAYTAGTHPYTVTRLDTATPSTVGTATQTVTYKAYDRPATITQGNYSAEFMYNASHDRVKMTVTLPSTDELTRYYIGGNYEVQVDDEQGITTENLYLGGDAYSAPMVLQSNGGTTWTPYVIGRDYLGSITHLAYTNGNWVERKNYGAWGTGSPVSALWRGYCGHEHLTMFGLINMNARLYDPVLGRFLSPDPFIQAPDIPGNFNRYAYCLNNPLKYNDRTGELFGIDDALLIATASVIIGGAIGGYQGYKIGKGKGATGDTMLGYIVGGVLVGGASALLGGCVATSVAPMVAAAGYGGFLGGCITGSFSGAAAGFINGFGFGLLSTRSFSKAFVAGGDYLLLGGLIGGFVGGSMQVVSDVLSGKSFSGSACSAEQTLQKAAKQAQFTKNKYAGKLGEIRAKDIISEQGGEVLGEQVTIEVNGTTVRPDLVVGFDDNTVLIEVKVGNGGFTYNQRIVYPQIQNPIPVISEGTSIPEYLSTQPIYHPEAPFIPKGANAMTVWGSADPITNYQFFTLRVNIFLPY
ncbi:MAG: VCBS repeat-containing protein, partial [Bacteroidales bacterium]|nr:VCBS repeat-containing protein [Bacteroidales bacterium]